MSILLQLNRTSTWRSTASPSAAWSRWVRFSDLTASEVAQTAKQPPATWETRVQSLGGEDPLEKEMATHSSILAWGILWTEEPGRLLGVPENQT